MLESIEEEYQAPPKEPKYPILKRSMCHLVLFTREKCGTVLRSYGSDGYPIGEYRTDWVESQFEVFHGKVTIKCP